MGPSPIPTKLNIMDQRAWVSARMLGRAMFCAMAMVTGEKKPPAKEARTLK